MWQRLMRFADAAVRLGEERLVGIFMLVVAPGLCAELGSTRARLVEGRGITFRTNGCWLVVWWWWWWWNREEGAW